MQNTVKQMIRSFTKRRTQRRRAYAAFTTLAILVSITTMYSLSQPASTMTGEPICGQTEHVHTDACYTEKLICGLEERTEAVEGAEEHVHDESCYEPREGLVCTEEAAEAHSHDESCYGLVCGETEYPAHTHGDNCYAVVTETCGQEEHEAHSHDESCYATTRSLTCGEAESAGHTHDDSCYDENGELICGQNESAGHTHSDSCYTESTALTCGQTESAGHTHDGNCTVERVELTCTAQEGPGHVHDDSCYGLICGLEETEGHAHTEECYETRDELVCAVGHVHTADCYEKVLTCQLPEHVHSSSCYEENAAEGSGEPGAPAYICGLPAHTHDDACLDEEGNLICGLEEHEHTEDCLALLPQEKVYTAGGAEQGFTVTVTAPADAVPQGAELKADLLDKNSDAYQEAAKALDHKEIKRSGFIALDVRFELDGEEVEPADTVQVEIDASGLIPAAADPDSVAVRHHKEEETKLLGLFETGTETVVETVADVTGEIGEVTVEDETFTAQFPVDSFSVFTITWGESKTLNVHYVNDEGMEIPGSQIREVYVPVGQWVVLGDYDSNGAEIDSAFAYSGAKLNSLTGTVATAVKHDGGSWYYTTDNPVTDETAGTKLDNALTDIYLVYAYERQDDKTEGYDENLANTVLSDTPKANDWQIVSGEYDSSFPYQYDGTEETDSHVRIRKEVMSTGVENEFYIYLEVGAKTSWKDLFFNSSTMVVTTANKYDPKKQAVYVGNEAKVAAGQASSLYLPDDPNRPPTATNKYLLEVQFYKTYNDLTNGNMYDQYTRECYANTNRVPNGSFLMYVPSVDKTIVLNRLDLTYAGDGIQNHNTITIKVCDTEINLGDIISDVSIKFTSVTDIMGNISGGVASYINYEGLVTANGNFIKNGDGTYQWNLPESAEIEKPDGSTEGSYWTTYRLLYKISLDVEAEGFNSCAPNQTDPYGDQYQKIDLTDSIYETNGLTTLKYTQTSTRGNGATETKDGVLSATSPQVQGLLYNYYLKKVDGSESPLPGATFTMTDQFGKAHSVRSNEAGMVSFIGLPWGNYTLTETQAPEGYVELANPVAENINLCYTDNGINLVQDTPDQPTMMKLSGEIAKVENQLANGDLTLTKNVNRTDGNDPEGEFTFLLKIPVEEADEYSYTRVFDATGKPVYGDDKLTFKAETGEGGNPAEYAVAEVILTHGQKIAVSLPIGVQVRIEEQAEGYSIRWTVKNNDNTTETHSSSITVDPIDADGVDVICTNTTGAELPQTGGMGTQTFTFLGMMMMLSAGVLLMIQRRRKEGADAA